MGQLVVIAIIGCILYYLYGTFRSVYLTFKGREDEISSDRAASLVLKFRKYRLIALGILVLVAVISNL